MVRSRSSADVRQKLACIQWVRTLFSHHDPVVLDTLLALADDPLLSIVDAVNVEMQKLLHVMEEEAKQSFDRFSAVLLSLLNATKTNEWIFASTPATEQLGVRGLAARYHVVKILGEVVAQQLKRTADYDDRTAVLNSFNRYDPFEDHIVVRENRSMLSVDEELFKAICTMLQSLSTSNSVDIELRQSSVLLPGTQDAHKAALSDAQLKMNSQLLKTAVLLARDALLLSGSGGAKSYCRTHGMLQSLISFLVLPDLSMSLHVAQCVASLCYNDMNFNAATQRILIMKVGALPIVDGAVSSTVNVVNVTNTLQCMGSIVEVLVDPGLTQKAVLQDVSVLFGKLLGAMTEILPLADRATAKTPLSYEVNYLLICSLRLLSRLASRKRLSLDVASKWLAESSLESVGLLLPRVADLLLTIFENCLSNGLSSGIVCAVAEAVTRVCVSGAFEGESFGQST